MITQPTPRIQHKGVIPITALIGLLGEDAALSLCRQYTGYQVPSVLHYLRAKRDAAVVRDWIEGASVAEICAKYGLTQPTVELKITEGLRGRKRQLEETT